MKKLYTTLSLILLISSAVCSQTANPNDPNDFQYVFVEAGTSHTVALRCNGTVACWGDNSLGQLGNNNSPTDSNVPVTVRITPGTNNLTDIIAVAAGANHTLALRSDGTVWSWGQNTNGQLGDNSTTQRNFAVQVRDVPVAGFLSNVVAIAAGASHSLAILNDGRAVAWGLNTKGQLADGTTTQRNRPVYMTGIDAGNTAYAVSAGDCHTYLLQSNGRVKSCGCDDDGQLGNDGNSGMTETTSLIYVNTNQTGTLPLESITGIASGPNHGLALDSTGTIWSWGIAGSPNYCLGRVASTPASKYAGQVSIITDAVAIAAGTNTGFALLSDSTVMTFGTDNLGQLGLGTGDNSTIDPTLIPSLAGVKAISAGGPHTIALLDNDSIYSFGDNSQGQLGIGITGGDRQSPVKVTLFNLGTIIADAGPDKFMCVGDSVQIGNETANYSLYTYLWQPITDLTGGTIVTNRPDTLARPFAKFPLANTINYKLIKDYRVGGNEVCLTIDTVKVSATDQAEAEFISSAPACVGDNLNFISTGNAGPYTTYQWDFGAGAIVPSGMDTVYNPTGITYSISGLKLVTLLVTDSCGSTTTTDTYSAGVLIRETPTASFSSNTPICSQNFVNFTNTGSTGAGWTYSWDFGSDAIPGSSTAQNPTGVTYSTPGIKTVTFTISNGYCFDTYIGNITINEAPVADFVSTAPQCTGLGVNFTNTGTTTGTWTYTWDFGSGATPATSTAQNPSGVVYSTAGNKTVRFIITNGTCSDTIFKTITIH
ncbi:MAG: PKD domain-containing protein, partial [Bacteroidales bacterium]|nr:PKD domain-containing protein [Bacteroidales bacterium]